MSKVGYNCIATNESNKAIVREENTRASMYLFLETNLGTFATAKNDTSGIMKNEGLLLKVSVTSGIKINVYKVVIPKLMIKKIIPFFKRKVNLACNRPSVFNKR